jgi:hypothetical protein
MKNKHLQFGHGFRVVFGNRHAQAAQMTLSAGQIEGGPDNLIAAPINGYSLLPARAKLS